MRHLEFGEFIVNEVDHAECRELATWLMTKGGLTMLDLISPWATPVNIRGVTEHDPYAEFLDKACYQLFSQWHKATNNTPANHRTQ